jgi:hypothetical protein
MTSAAAAKLARKIAFVAVDTAGVTHTRTTDNPYTHVVMAKVEQSYSLRNGTVVEAGSWVPVSWHTRQDLAEKNRSTRWLRNRTTQVVTCAPKSTTTNQEHTTMTTTATKATRKPAARKAAPAKPTTATKAAAKPAAGTKAVLVPGTDAHVIEFVRAQRKASPGVGVAAMLKTYRGSGAKCSQERFRAIAQTLAAKAAGTAP